VRPGRSERAPISSSREGKKPRKVQRGSATSISKQGGQKRGAGSRFNWAGKKPHPTSTSRRKGRKEKKSDKAKSLSSHTFETYRATSRPRRSVQTERQRMGHIGKKPTLIHRSGLTAPGQYPCQEKSGRRRAGKSGMRFEGGKTNDKELVELSGKVKGVLIPGGGRISTAAKRKF